MTTKALTFVLLASSFGISAATIQTTTFATGGLSRSPDSITADATSVFVEYGNRASNTGANANPSTIVRYNFDGSVRNTYSVPGLVDGLKFNQFTGQLWALQNQDGNSLVTVIDPNSGTQTHYTYAGIPANSTTTTTNGFDDAVFTSGTTAYLSRTNPNGDPNAAIIVSASLSGTVFNLSPILLYGATGTTLSGTSVANDPDSLKQDLNGNLVLSSGDDGATITVQNPGVGQTVTPFQLNDSPGTPSSGLDDTAFTSAASGTLLVTDTPNNVVQALYITGLVGNTEFASVGSANTVGIVDPGTGLFASIGTFGPTAAPHGLLFIPNAQITASPEPSTVVFSLAGLAAVVLFRKRLKLA